MTVGGCAMTATFTTTATITDGKTLTLDTPAPVGTGRVRVTVEALAEEPKPKWLEVLDEIRAGQIARGHVPMTREEIDAFMAEERAGWDHRP